MENRTSLLMAKKSHNIVIEASLCLNITERIIKHFILPKLNTAVKIMRKNCNKNFLSSAETLLKIMGRLFLLVTQSMERT